MSWHDRPHAENAPQPLIAPTVALPELEALLQLVGGAMFLVRLRSPLLLVAGRQNSQTIENAIEQAAFRPRFLQQFFYQSRLLPGHIVKSGAQRFVPGIGLPCVWE